MTRDSSEPRPHDSRPEPEPREPMQQTKPKPGIPGWLAAVFQRLVLWTSPHAALLITLAVGLIPAVLLTLGSAEVYESVSDSDGVAQLDQPVLDAALTLRSPEVDSAVTAFTNLAGTVGMPILAGTAMVIMALKWRSWTPVLLIAAAAAGSLLMTVAGKDLVGRVRPPLTEAVPPFEHSASFPSGHSLNAVVIAGVVAYLIVLHLHSRGAKVLTVLLAAGFSIAVGLSRVFLGHHWFTDVLVAWTLGLAWLAVVITAHRLLHTRRMSRSEAAAGA